MVQHNKEELKTNFEERTLKVEEIEKKQKI